MFKRFWPKMRDQHLTAINMCKTVGPLCAEAGGGLVREPGSPAPEKGTEPLRTSPLLTGTPMCPGGPGGPWGPCR